MCGFCLGRKGGKHRPSQAGHFQLTAKCTCQHLLRQLLLGAASLSLVEKGVSFLSKEDRDDGPSRSPHSSQLGELETPNSDKDVLNSILLAFAHAVPPGGKAFPSPNHEGNTSYYNYLPRQLYCTLLGVRDVLLFMVTTVLNTWVLHKCQ